MSDSYLPDNEPRDILLSLQALAARKLSHAPTFRKAAEEILLLRAENEKLLRRIHLFKNTRNEQVFEKLMKANEEIERLRFKNEKLNKTAVHETVKVATLRAALKRIAEQDAVEMALDPQWARRAARAALGEKNDN